jgi:hypothetical protein
MNIKKHIKKMSKFSSIGLLFIGFIIGLFVMFLYFQPNLAYRGHTIQGWEQIDKGDKQNANFWSERATACENDPSSDGCNPILNLMLTKTSCDSFTSTSAAAIVWRYKHCPTPTPIVEYKTQTQYVEQPAQPQSTSSRCTPDYAGGMYCTSDTGVRTHCTSNYAGGYNCN